MIRFKVPGHEINALIEERLAPALDGVQIEHAILALTTTLVEIIRPDLEEQELTNKVEEVGQLLMLQLSDSKEETIH